MPGYTFVFHWTANYLVISSQLSSQNSTLDWLLTWNSITRLTLSAELFFITILHGQMIKHRFQQYPYFYMFNHFRVNLFTEQCTSPLSPLFQISGVMWHCYFLPFCVCSPAVYQHVLSKHFLLPHNSLSLPIHSSRLIFAYMYYICYFWGLLAAIMPELIWTVFNGIMYHVNRQTAQIFICRNLHRNILQNINLSYISWIFTYIYKCSPMFFNA
jgi:hypothetical protein